MSEHAHEHYEPGGVHTSYVLLAAAGFLTLMIVAVGLLHIIYNAAVPQPRPEAPKLFPAPRLEADPAAELHRLLARQRKEMSSYRWANSDHTLIAIPIDQAMELIAKRGAEAYGPIPSAPKKLPPGSPPLVPPLQASPTPHASSQTTPDQAPPSHDAAPNKALPQPEAKP
jgi:hypothetical protein